jgi:hypothetical protein
MSGSPADPLALLECGDCTSMEFHLTVNGGVYCAKCDGKINARLIYKFPTKSSSPPTDAAPSGAA